MINDPKSQHFIAWTDLGTSFVVSNVGEFSRSILGSHFKHNNVGHLPLTPVPIPNIFTVLQFRTPIKHVRVSQNKPRESHSGFRSHNHDTLSPQTPRAQRTSTDAQTWEFSHHKFLRGRPDLLDEIKRKALEPDPAVKHRVELPCEVSCYSFRVLSIDNFFCRPGCSAARSHAGRE